MGATLVPALSAAGAGRTWLLEESRSSSNFCRGAVFGQGPLGKKAHQPVWRNLHQASGRAVARFHNIRTQDPEARQWEGGLRESRRQQHRLSMAVAGATGSASDSNLLIVGPGVLGSYLGKLWLEQHPSAVVVGQTNSTTNHEKLQALGFKTRLKSEANSDKFPFVAFCAPPSGSEDYVGEVKRALDLWDGSGSFVFTSSAGVYAEDSGGPITEESALAPAGNPRLDPLKEAESAVLERGGNVVRLAGLYHAQRGAHTFFLRAGSVERWGATRSTSFIMKMLRA
eukprot:jgi/Botrbrau1/10578/Bobra.0358s0001.1